MRKFITANFLANAEMLDNFMVSTAIQNVGKFDPQVVHRDRINLLRAFTYVYLPKLSISQDRYIDIKLAVEKCTRFGRCLLPRWNMADCLRGENPGRIGIQIADLMRSESLEVAGAQHALKTMGEKLRAIDGFAPAPRIYVRTFFIIDSLGRNMDEVCVCAWICSESITYQATLL